MFAKNTPCLIFKNNLRQSLRFRVRDADRYALHAKLSGDFCGFSSQRNARAAALLANNFQINPANTPAPPGPERLHSRFFGGESPSIALELILEPLAIFDFLGREDAIKKSLAMAFDGRLHAGHLGNIYTQANDQEIFLARRRHTSREL